MARGPQPANIILTQKQKEILESIIRRQTNPQNWVRRACIILIIASGMNNQQAAEEQNLDRKTVRIWRERWCLPMPSGHPLGR